MKLAQEYSRQALVTCDKVVVHTLAAMGVGSHVDLRPADLVMQFILGPGQTQLGRTNNRKNPSRARRSQLRFENFQRKKVEEKSNAEGGRSTQPHTTG